jgi:chromosome segregation ATPase
VSKVENKLKALADAGANDPNPNRIEQLAGVTAKVADLESSLSTKLAALRTDLTKDVDSRVQTATAASATAQAATQRLDKDVAGLKTDTARIDASVNANREATAKVAAELKSAQDQTVQLKSALDALKTEVAKPAEIAAAVAPIADKTASLEKSVAQVVQTESERQKTAEQVVLALELQNLKRALDSGQKYSTQLAEVKKLAAGTVDLASLTKLQDTGVPTLTELKKEFRSAANSAMDAESASEKSGVIDRLWSEAKSVVRVRRINLKPDDKSTEAVLGRMQVALNDGRLSDVLDASKDLSPEAKDAARPFLDRLSARVSVDRSLAQLESQLKSSIAPGASPAEKSAP